MKKLVWWGELLAGLGLLSVGFLQDCSLTFGKPIISYVLWPTILLAALVCIYRLMHWKNYWHAKNIWLLTAFCISYLVSTAVNFEYGWYGNIRTLILQGYLFFLVYCYRKEEEQNKICKYEIWSLYYIIVCLILVATSFGYFLTGHNKIYFPEIPSIPLYYTGFYWGRLYGVFWDPNIGALMCCVSVLLVGERFRRSKGVALKLAMSAVVLLDVLYIAFSDSRTGRIALVVGVAAFALLLIKTSAHKKSAMGCAVLAIILAALIPVGIKQGYNHYALRAENIQEEQLQESVDEKLASDRETESPQDKGTETVIRETNTEEAGSDYSNRRLDIWKSALEIFRAEPLFGVGHNTVLAYVEAEQPDSYLINNDHMHFESMHNTFFDVLVGQGIVGLLLYLALGLSFLIVIIKKWPVIVKNTSGGATAMLATLLAMVCASCFMSEIVYVCSPMSFVFWMGLGRMMQASESQTYQMKE